MLLRQMAAVGLLVQAVLLSRAHAGEPRIVLVRDESRQDGWVEKQFVSTGKLIEQAGYGFTALTGAEIERGGLLCDEYDLVVLPYCPGLSREAKAWVNLFCADGGRAAAFYSPAGLEEHLGLESAAYVRQEFEGQFAEVCFLDSAPEGTPASFRQDSWNIRAPSPGPDAKIIAYWHDKDGNRTRYPAASLSEGGMFFSHILITEDTAAAAAWSKATIRRLMKGERTQPAPVAIVRGTETERVSPDGDGKLVPQLCKVWTRAFEAGGIKAVLVTDEMAAKGALRGKLLAVMPLNHRMAENEARALTEHVAGGGRLVVCFNSNAELGRLAGVKTGAFTPGEGKRFRTMRLMGDAGPLAAVFPEEIPQNAWNAFACEPLPEATVLYEWLDSDGAPDAVPAVVVSERGAYLPTPFFGRSKSASRDLALGLFLRLCGTERLKGVIEALRKRLWYFRRYRTPAELRDALWEKGRFDLVRRLVNAQVEEGHVRAVAERRSPSDEALLDCYARLRRLRAELEEIFVRHASSPETELRAVWCHKPSMADWDATFRRLRQAGFNAFIPNMCHGWDAYYPSEFLKPAKDLAGDRMTPMLSAARRHGIEVHVWKVNWNLWRHDRGEYEKLVGAGRIAVGRTGSVAAFNEAFLCPSHPENRRLEIDSMIEIVKNFPGIAGIHFDYIRYRSEDYCYCPGCQKRFESETGEQAGDWPGDVLREGELKERYLQFRRDRITRVVSQVSEGARKIRKDIKVSAAVFGDWPRDRDRIGQDTLLWLERGYLDFVCPMNYTADAEHFEDRVRRQAGWTRGRAKLTPGIGAFVIESVWEIADQIMIARENGAEGFVLFDYQEAGAPLPYVQGLRSGPTRNPAETPWTK